MAVCGSTLFLWVKKSRFTPFAGINQLGLSCSKSSSSHFHSLNNTLITYVAFFCIFYRIGFGARIGML